MSWLLVLSVLWLGVVAVLIGRALSQRRHLEILPEAAIDLSEAPAVAVIVPARDEAQNIEPCVRSLLTQIYPEDRLRIIIVDDGSVDETPAIVQALAQLEPRIELLRCPSLPAGWTGKSHACWIGAQSVAEDIEWLCFIDADMRGAPSLLASAVACANAENLSLLSLAPRHELVTFAERLIIPCGLCFLGFRQNLRGARPEHPHVVATGQFFLARRSAYEALGGHSSVRAEICEDLELARLFKRNGARVCLKDGHMQLSTRMYTGWSTLWPGFAKNLTVLLGGTGAAIAAAIASILLVWTAVFLPVSDALACNAGQHAACLALVPAGLASAAVVALHIACAIHLEIPFRYGLLFPAGYTLGAVMVFDSVRWRLRGRVSWKGRNYLSPRPGAGPL